MPRSTAQVRGRHDRSEEACARQRRLPVGAAVPEPDGSRHVRDGNPHGRRSSAVLGSGQPTLPELCAKVSSSVLRTCGRSRRARSGGPSRLRTCEAISGGHSGAGPIRGSDAAVEIRPGRSRREPERRGHRQPGPRDVEWRGGARRGDPADPAGQRVGRRECGGHSCGESQQPDLAEVHGVQDGLGVGRPVDDPPSRRRIRPAGTRAVGSRSAHAQAPVALAVGNRMLPSRYGRPMRRPHPRWPAAVGSRGHTDGRVIPADHGGRRTGSTGRRQAAPSGS